MTFTVVVPVYNAEKFLRECLESIASMRIPQGADLEVLLIENGSRDKSPEICKLYSQKYEFIKTFHHGSIGAYYARREGMKEASGDYIFFADADDKMDAGALEVVCGFLNRNAAKLPDIILHNAAGMKTPDQRMLDFGAAFEPGKIYGEQEKEPFYEVMCRNDSLNALWNKVISSRLAKRIVENERCEMTKLNHGEDLLQTAELLDEAKSIVYLDEITYYYRDNAEGLTGSFHREFLNNQVDAWNAFDKYAQRWTNGRFEGLIAERKALTCAIAVRSLVYSMLGTKKKKAELERIMESPFYGQYGTKALPEWAPEGDAYIHGLMTGEQPLERLIAVGRNYRIKAMVKKILGR